MTKVSKNIPEMILEQQGLTEELVKTTMEFHGGVNSEIPYQMQIGAGFKHIKPYIMKDNWRVICRTSKFLCVRIEVKNMVDKLIQDKMEIDFTCDIFGDRTMVSGIGIISKKDTNLITIKQSAIKNPALSAEYEMDLDKFESISITRFYGI